MVRNAETPKLSMVSAIARLKSGNLDTLSPADLVALREAVETHPSITEFGGCEDALERLDALERERATHAPEKDSGSAVSSGGNWTRLAAGVAALVALLMGIVSFASWSRHYVDRMFAANPDIPTSAPAVRISEPPVEETVNEPEKPEAKSLAVEAKTPTSPVAPESTPAPVQEPVLAKDSQRPTLVVSGAGARLVDEPDGGFLLTSVNGSDLVRLTGKVSRLVLSDLNGRCTLDLGELESPLIEFRGDVNGLAKIIVKSAGADISFRGTINGNPHISITAPGGKVRFSKLVQGSATLVLDVPGGEVVFAGNEKEKAELGGGVNVQVNAGKVEFSGGMEAGAHAKVTLDGAAILRFSRLDGGSSIRYRKADDTDTEPTVEGDLSGTGKLIADVSTSR